MRKTSLVTAVCSLLVAACFVAPERQSATITPAAGQQEEQCTLGETQPLVDDAKVKVTVQRVRTGPRELVERFALDKSTTVDLTQGGCAHYGVKVIFTDRSRSGDQKPAAPLREAITLLERLAPLVKGFVFEDMLAILKGQQENKFRVGDAIQDNRFPDVTLYVNLERHAAQQKVLVTYSFVL